MIEKKRLLLCIVKTYLSFFNADDDEGVLKIGKERQRAFHKDGKHKQELDALSELKREVLKDEYAGFDDPEFNDLLHRGSPESLFSDGKYEEIGCEENLELLKYEHDIDLLLAGKENERLRAEIGTLTTCVDVFHDECECLKRSLDKTLNMVGILRDERDDLMKKHDTNMAEHSELVLDLIKYEETISRLEQGNEKLEDNRRLLEECLMEKQAMLFLESPSEKQAILSYNPKTETNFSTQDDRLEEDERKLLRRERRAENQALFPNNPKAERSMQLGLEADEFLRNDTQFPRKSSEYKRNETEFVRKGGEYQRNDADVLGKNSDVLEKTESLMLENLMKEVELERRFLDTDDEGIMRRLPSRDEMFRNRDDWMPERTKYMKKQRQNGNKKSTAQGIGMQFAKDSQTFHEERAFEDDFAGTFPSMDSTGDAKKQRQDGNRKSVGQDNEGYRMRNKSNVEGVLNHSRRSYKEPKISPQHAKTEENRPFSKYRCEVQTSELNMATPQRSSREMKSLRGTKRPGKPKLKTSSLLQEKNERQTSKSKNESALFPARDKFSYNSPNSLEVMRNATPSSRFPKRTGRKGIAEYQKSLKSDSINFSPKLRRVPGTAPSNGSTLSSPNFSNSSILTSTRANLTTTDRLVPNLSGFSPIVSPLDRHYHAEKLKWQVLAGKQSDVSRANHDNTTFLLNIDPNEFLQTPITANRDGFTSSRAKIHNRSRSADDRLLTSSREMTLSRELYQDKPLHINFEDFIFRHRVKSSEDVANIRDPSPAELWFS